MKKINTTHTSNFYKDLTTDIDQINQPLKKLVGKNIERILTNHKIQDETLKKELVDWATVFVQCSRGADAKV